MRRVETILVLGILTMAGCRGGDSSPASGIPAGAMAALELETAYPEPFSFLNSVRERADGTVMAADPLSQVILRLDLVAGTADTLGRVGEGPGEFQQPDQVFPLPGDSTLLVDVGKVQLTVIGPDGTLHDGMKMANSSPDGRLTLLMPRTVDALGRIYFTGSRGMGGEGPPDSTVVLRYDRRTEATDTMGWAWRPEPNITRSGGNVRMMSTQMEGRDDWAVGPGGEFAIVRATGYLVEWRHPDGRLVTGPENPFESRSISEDDKYAFLEQRSSAGLSVMITSSSSGGGEMSMSRGGGGFAGDGPNLLDFEWAEEFPPFRPDRSRVAPTGELWVERWMSSGQDPQMDVFDQEGIKMGTVNLPEGRELIGFGSTADGDRAVYLLRTDEFDLKWLERYRLVR